MEYRLDDYHGKSYNLQLIRFIAAILVIFSHSFRLATGKYNTEWLYIITNGQIDFGGFSVSIFFLCGGFFSAKSILEKQELFSKRLVNRYIRLAKPLAFVVILSIVGGCFFSSFDVVDYFISKDTYLYLFNILLLPIHNLPGVFENNILFSTVNGALWTLPLEFLCFCVCAIAGKIEVLSKKRIVYTIPVVIIGEFIIWQISASIPILKEVIRPTILFYVGILYYLFKRQVVFSRINVIVSLILLATLEYLGLLFWGMVICFPYLCLYSCFNKKQIGKRLAKIGDYSYSMYLWGFPVQQALISLYGGQMNPYINFVISVPIVILFGIITHFLTEKAHSI